MATLVIRPHHQAQKVIILLKNQGIEAHIQPTLEIEPLSHDLTQIDLPSIQAITITSQNALHSVVDHSIFHPYPLYCVGKATADLASSFGYPYIHSADGNAADLLALIQQSCSPQAGSMLHMTCPEAPFPFAEQLTLAGYHVQKLMVYRSRLLNNFTENVQSNLRQGLYKNVLLFSPRSASHFVHLCQFHQLEDQLRVLSAFCLSPAIAQAINHVPWQNIYISAKPKLNALIGLLFD